MPLLFLPLIIGVLYLLQYVGSLLFTLANWLLNMMLDLNYGILDENSLIETGWTIVRDITNLGFVLVIIVIAISTIIRYEKYGMKTLLPKLIGAAIIVNFSLTLSGVFIDFSHSMTRFFFEPLQGHGALGLAGTISAAFRPQSLLADTEDIELWQPDTGGNLISNSIVWLSGFVFTIIFTFMAAFVVGALAIMFFLRYLNLSFLLILSPIVWLFWVVPSFQKYHGQWWDAFMKWIIFGPAASFFIYLSLVSIERLGEAAAGSDSAMFTSSFGGQLGGIMKHGVNLVVLTGFFFGSLIVAQKVGVAGSKGAMGLAKKASGSAKKYAGNFVKQRAKNARDTALSLGQKTNAKGETTTFAERRMSGLANSKWLRHVPGYGGVLRAGQNTLAKQKAGRAAAAATAQKSLTDLTLEDLKARASLRTSSPTERAALGMELIKRGKLNELQDGEGRLGNKMKTNVLNAIQQTNNVKNAISINPLLAEQLLDLEEVKKQQGFATDQEAKDFVVQEAAKKLTAEKAAALDDAALMDARVMASVSTGVMARLANEGFEKMEKAEKTLKDVIEKNRGAAKDTKEANIKALAERNLRSLLHNTQYQDDRTSRGESTPAARVGAATDSVANVGNGGGGAGTIRET